jgi:vacuolar protein sorting-associated protein 13A/C
MSLAILPSFGNPFIFTSTVVLDLQVLHVSSCVEVHNLTALPFELFLKDKEETIDVGVCNPNDEFRASSLSLTITEMGATLAKPSRRFGISVDKLSAFHQAWSSKGRAHLSLALSPQGVQNYEFLGGDIVLEPSLAFLQGRPGKKESHRFEVVCRSESSQAALSDSRWRDPLAVVVRSEVSLVDGNIPSIEIFLEPRALIENNLPVSISVRTPMPHTFNTSKPFDQTGGDPDDERRALVDSSDTIHDVLPGNAIQIFTPGPSIAVAIKCSEMPIGGTPIGWMDGGWIDLPLLSEFRLVEPLRCRFPFVQAANARSFVRSGSLGTDFYIAEGVSSLDELASEESASQSRAENTESSDKVEVTLSGINTRTFNVTVLNYAIDHTGGILFEQVVTEDNLFRQSSSLSSPQRSSISKFPNLPLTTFASPRHRSRISLLPSATVSLRVIYLTMEEDEGMARSAPFRIEDVSICHGGAESTSIKWADGRDSGFYAYRRLVNSYQSEIHLIPEFIIFNGSKTYDVQVTVQNGASVAVERGQVAPLRAASNDEGLIISVEYAVCGVRSPPLRVDSLGLRVAFLRSHDGTVLGSLAMQTVIGTSDSRLVVKLGEMRLGSQARGVPSVNAASSPSFLQDDFLRFRVRWTELRVTLNSAPFSPYGNKEVLIVKTALNRILETDPPKHSESWSGSPSSEQKKKREMTRSHAVCTIVLSRFTVDWQRVFKEERTGDQAQSKRPIDSTERSQLSVIVHNVQVRDETPGSPYPIVFDSTSTQISFFDLCVRFRGPLDADLIKVDLLDLNMAHVNGISESIVVNTSEDFIWKMLDLANRLVVATAEVSGAEIQLKWDDRKEEYVVIMIDEHHHSSESKAIQYSPPKSDTLFDINIAKVSPFTMVVTFKRAPLASRYKLLKDFHGATLLNYFTRRLKFKIDKAELKFSRYETRNIKGPPDRVLQELMAVYLARMKLKLVTLMTAASFQDWKFLASRDKGDDEYMEGDLLRVTGNLAGNTAGYIFKNMGRGLGSGVSAVTSSVGDSFENATEMVGAGSLGAGVNSLITGIGDGVGSTITGGKLLFSCVKPNITVPRINIAGFSRCVVGTGAGKVARGAGKGIGHVFGGGT